MQWLANDSSSFVYGDPKKNNQLTHMSYILLWNRITVQYMYW